MKRWFEDWRVTFEPRKRVKRDKNFPIGGYVTVELPNSKNGKTVWRHYFNAGDLEQAHGLTNILLSAFDQIQRDSETLS